AGSCRLENAYAASPVCSPSRAALLTGRVPARVGVTQWIGGTGVGELLDVPYHHALPVSEYALPRALRDGGYATWHVGKWHLGDGAHGPLAHGFEVNIAGGHIGSPRTYFAPWGIEHLPEAEPGTYLTDALTDHAIDLVRSHDGERPFFLHMAHYAVHTPLEAPRDLVEKYARKAQQLGLDPEAGPADPAPHRPVPSHLCGHGREPRHECGPSAGRARGGGRSGRHDDRVHLRQRRPRHRGGISHLVRTAGRGQGLDRGGRGADPADRPPAGWGRLIGVHGGGRARPGPLPHPAGCGRPPAGPDAARRRGLPAALAARHRR